MLVAWVLECSAAVGESSEELGSNENLFRGNTQNRKAQISQALTGECGVCKVQTVAKSVHETLWVW